ncbi:hypothetical protein [Sinorhizobium sp. BJ1]|uniref:hypothetical protein n=1 Tax=Sinorhizobium sp. BJ1 TaxID=2035455 RepID=UPI000BE958BD|nr:hypothetical protein [Sinorhizobium sp. BJ1]PDT86524.1 hypothetical protein CO676_02215 [Sinorhizobium sp. BJ1]
MPKKIEKGSRVTLSAEVTRVGDDGMVTVHVRGYHTPITLPEKYLSDIQPAPKEKPVGGRRKFYDRGD